MAIAKFICIECKTETEVNDNETTRRCSKCYSRYLELISGTGKMKYRQPWTSKTFRP